jgi:Flp pilus assembly protein TadD
MSKTLLFLVALAMAVSALATSDSWARDTLKITIPKRSELTPVQRLNREGVAAVEKHQYDKAESLFYKAYLYDPADPFTLNNLGYISELQGQLDRANKFYARASEQSCSATIDKSNAKNLEGKPMEYAFKILHDVPMRVNRMNVDAITLLAQDRGFEAIALLREALALDPQNSFTQNNLGVAHEAIGDYDHALKYYSSAVEGHSLEPVVVTLDRSWRGRSVSNMAAESARRLEARIQKMDSAEAHAVLLTLRGVTATNKNDWPEARQDFMQAYSLDPSSAFSLNNRGYVAEMDGDLESAQFFYDKARKADDSNVRVGLASLRSAEGKRLVAVAAESNQQVDGELDSYSQERHRQTGPIELTPRISTPGGVSGLVPDKPSPANVPPVPIPTVTLSTR